MRESQEIPSDSLGDYPVLPEKLSKPFVSSLVMHYRTLLNPSDAVVEVAVSRRPDGIGRPPKEHNLLTDFRHLTHTIVE